MRKYFTELIGTAVFVFVIYGSSVQAHPLAPIAIGGALTAVVYAGAHISGGHFNPAVSMSVCLRGKLAGTDAAAYVLAQLIGGVLGALACRWVAGAPTTPAFDVNGTADIMGALVAEFVITANLCYVVLNVATSKDNPNNSFYGLAIGLAVLAGAVAVGKYSGGAFNPAVALGGMVTGLFSWSMLWIFLVAQVLGGAAAALAFRVVNTADMRA